MLDDRTLRTATGETLFTCNLFRCSTGSPIPYKIHLEMACIDTILFEFYCMSFGSSVTLSFVVCDKEKRVQKTVPVCPSSKVSTAIANCWSTLARLPIFQSSTREMQWAPFYVLIVRWIRKKNLVFHDILGITLLQLRMPLGTIQWWRNWPFGN